MKPTRDSLDEWKAYAGEMERKARKYETRYRNASDGLITVESLLIDAHAVLTLAMATPRTVPSTWEVLFAEDAQLRPRSGLPRIS